MKLEFIEVSKLKESPYNPRIHPEKALERLEKSIEKFGFTNPILVQKSTNQIIAGHARLKAAKEAGLKKVPVIFLDFDDVTAKAYNITDNRLAELTEWDYPKLKDLITEIDTGAIDVELTGFDDEELKEIFDYDSGNGKEETFDVDAELEKIKKAKTKTGDLYQLGEHRLLCGDATKKEDVERLMDGKKADMVFTDPPYGINLDTDYTAIMNRGKQYSKVIGDEIEWNFNKANWFDCAEQFWFGAENYRYTLPRNGSWFVWDKQISEHDGASHTGSLFELLWSKTKHKREIINAPYFRFYGMDTKERLHPTQKPVILLEWFIKKFSIKDNLIIDLFGGSGSTLIACEKLNRKCRMMEIDQLYCDVIIKRWEDFASKKAILIK